MSRPTRQIEPLLPPPGRFDQVVREARGRRYRRAAAVTGVAGVFLAGIMGGLALGGVGRVQEGILGVVALPGQDKGSESPSPTTTSARATTVPGGTKTTHKQHPTHRTSTPGQPPVQLAMVRGHVVDSAGAPVADAYVYTGNFHGQDFVPKALPAARTGPSGRFSIPCEGPVLLAPWPLNSPMHNAANAQVAATKVTAPVCSRVADPQVMTMKASGAIEGHVLTDIGCADQDFRLSVWLDGSPTTSVRLTHLREGDAFSVSGLPPGRHVLHAHGKQLPLTLADTGTTVTRDVTFACPNVPTPTDVPTLSTSPAPTPSETSSPSPSSPPPASPSPSPTGSKPSS